MQSRLYFSRLGRPSLQHASSSLEFISSLLPRSATRRISTSVSNGQQKAQPIVGGEGSTYTGNNSKATSQWNQERILGHGEPVRSTCSQEHQTSLTSNTYLRIHPNPGTQTEYASWRPVMFKNQRLSELVTPSIALAKYLDLEDPLERQAYWRDIKDVLAVNSLQTILLHHLYITSVQKDDWDHHDHTFRSSAIHYLETRNLNLTDIERWSWVLDRATFDEQSFDQCVKRLVCLPSNHPTFLILEALRRDIHHVEILRKLILHAWKHLEEKCSHEGNAPESEGTIKDFGQMQDGQFKVMVSRLLYHTRRIWPAAMVSVANMVPFYIRSIRDGVFQDHDELDHRVFARSCDLINYVLRLLALPASLDPLKSMSHNWSAQKVLLNLAGQCDPPLMLEQDSYRAVIQVLTASQKTDRESKAAILRLRSWPPWRTDHDGMDAQRTSNDDLSRALLAAIRSREAGFREASHDRRMRILGGQELDGTPTIHTRKLVKWRPRCPSKGMDVPAKSPDEPQPQVHTSGDDPHVWGARVEATRDVREAWRAFVAFTDKGGKPNQALYLAMFQKLNFENARLGRKTAYEAAPGDGREVLSVPDDNMSDFYKSHSQPPRLGVLYKQMLSSGLKPSGQLLIFLVRHARTSVTGINYLRDGGMNPLVLQYWTGGKDTWTSPNLRPPLDAVNTVSDRVLGAFIHLICRFAPRAVLTTPDDIDKRHMKPVQLKASASKAWAIRELEKNPYPRLRDPLRQAARLLKNEQVKFKPAWYSLFKALGHRNILLRFSLIGEPEHDALAWRFTVATLSNFHEIGLELDPFGFLLICNVFFKYAEATHDVSPLTYEAELTQGAQLLKDEFAKLSRSEALPFCAPTLLHSVKWVTLHMYVRCMGIIGNCEDVIAILEWMVQHREELEDCNSQDRNGPIMLTRTLVAARISCYETEYEQKAIDLVKQVDSWKWPDDDDLEQYTGSLEIDPEEDVESAETTNPDRER